MDVYASIETQCIDVYFYVCAYAWCMCANTHNQLLLRSSKTNTPSSIVRYIELIERMKRMSLDSSLVFVL